MPQRCLNQGFTYAPKSFAVSGQKNDIGNGVMLWLKDVKEKTWQMREDCLADGTCPELAPFPSSGMASCVNGECNMKVFPFLYFCMYYTVILNREWLLPFIFAGYASHYPCRHVNLLSHVNLVDLGGDRNSAR